MDRVKLDLYQDDSLNCLQNAIAVFANFHHENFRIMFLDSWEFLYNTKTDIILDKIIFQPIKHLDNLSEFCGISVEYEKCPDFNLMVEIIKRNLKEQHPVSLLSDGYICDWMKHSYKISHSVHFFFVTGVDEIGENFYICDCNPIYEGRIVNRNELEQLYNGEYMIMSHRKKSREIDVDFIHSKILTQLPTEEQLKDIYKYAEDISKVDVGEEIGKYKTNILGTPLLDKFQGLGRQRQQYSEALQYIAEKYNNSFFDEEYKKMKSISQKWLMIKGLLIKCVFSTNVDKQLGKVNEFMKQIAEEELMVLRELKSYKAEAQASDTLHKENQKMLSENEKYRYVNLDLTDYYNSKGVGDENNGALSSGGAVILRQYFENASLWKKCTKVFTIADRNSVADNVICNNQIINVPENEYKAICVLGCCEWGSFSDKMILSYEKETETKDIMLTDWGLQECTFSNEEIVWSGKAYTPSENGGYTFPVNIYASLIPLDSKEKLIKIQLPECENMHIFAISLYY